FSSPTAVIARVIRIAGIAPGIIRTAAVSIVIQRGIVTLPRFHNGSGNQTRIAQLPNNFRLAASLLQFLIDIVIVKSNISLNFLWGNLSRQSFPQPADKLMSGHLSSSL